MNLCDFQTRYKNIYKVTDIDYILSILTCKFITTNKHIQYANIPISFDIETTSFIEFGEKKATMYVWSFCIDGYIIMGRTWNEYIELVYKLNDFFELSSEKRIIIYIQFLSYEFQFFRKYFEWEKIFSLDLRKPCYALSGGIEYRCSYILSGYSLANIGKNLTKYKVEKMVGDLDYSLMRHSKTPLTEKEIMYSVNDVRVVVAYIQECIEEFGDITLIPLTNTGRVRNFVRKECLYKNPNYKKFYNMIHSLTIDVDEYQQLKRAFMGGFTHASALRVGRTLTYDDMRSIDFTSSYPYSLVAFKFPMSKSQVVNVSSREEFNYYINNYCCVFDLELENVEPLVIFENYISSSKCFKLEKAVINNGRVVSCSLLATTITDVDFRIINKFYKFSNITVTNFRIYKKGYLPTEIVKSILSLYAGKTTKKGIKELEVEYLREKGMLNSVYGMMVTDILRDNIVYCESDDDEKKDWSVSEVDGVKTISKYNNSKKRFISYPWGIFCTAYSRYNLFTGIYEFGEDYIYSDTDSIKCKNYHKHIDYVNDYNASVKDRLEKASKYHNLDFELFEPKTNKGEKKLLGVWDDEGKLVKFKTLGAKRYMYTDDKGHTNLTLAGVNKKTGCEYILKQKNPYDFFDIGMTIPEQYSGKTCMTYIDKSIDGCLTDYTGETCSYHEESFIHGGTSEYNLSLSGDFINYLKGVRVYEK